MKSDPASLNNLRDIVVPDAVSWWPPAPGWWVLGFIFGIIATIAVYRAWKTWQSNAYRRQGTAELKRATNDAEIVAILKRVAICADSRPHVGGLVGSEWCQWLSDTGGKPMPGEVAERIIETVYRDGSKRSPALVQFAGQWISEHRTKDHGQSPSKLQSSC